MPLIPVFKKERQVDFCEFETSLIYRVSSRTARATEKPCLKKKKIPVMTIIESLEQKREKN